MNEALQLIYHFFNTFITWVFGLYFFPGVSLGMFFFVLFIFTVLLHYLLSVPRVRIKGGRSAHGRIGKDSNTD